MRLLSVFALALTVPALSMEYSHGTSYLEPLKYPRDFQHFEYVNPDAPKGGLMRASDMGTFDSFNHILDKGRVVAGTDLMYDRLLERAIDEPASYYCRLAEGVWVADDYRRIAFKIREGAYWHDGEPLTADDVVFTFRTIKEKGSAGYRTALRELGTIEKTSANEVLFTTIDGASGSPNLVFAIGGISILPEHYWADRDISKTTLEPPLGSGPYRAGKFSLGRNIFYDRVENYWGADLPVNRGRHNFGQIKFDYFMDENIMLEAIKGDVIDVRHESVSKNWTTAYDFPAVRAGYFNKVLVDLSKPWGLWWPVMWNLDHAPFQDIRVREALWLLSDFRWTNRVLMYGFYNYANSYFYNSKMAATGLPSEAELKLLEPWRGKIPDRVFTHPWLGNETTGFGYDRDKIDLAIELLGEAGYESRDGAMVDSRTGQPLQVDFVFISPYALRQETPLMNMMNMVGIKTTAVAPELSNWLYRMRNGLFDGGVYAFEPSNTPGLQLRNRFGTAAANSKAGQNWSRIRNPAVDAMIDHIMSARDPETFYAATRALDRILLWNFYHIPGLGAPGYRLVYWEKFGIPKDVPRLSRVAWIDTWWWDEAKAAGVQEWMANLSSE